MGLPAAGSARVLVATAAGTSRSLLSGRGFHVLEAGDSVAALRSAIELEPDVVLLDDLELLDRFKADPGLAHIPVVVMSGAGSSNDVADGLGRGAHDYLREPIDPAELVARVMGAVRMKSLQDSLRSINAELRLTAGTDSLTGLPNRRMAAEQLDRLISRACRHNLPFSLLLADVDHFKQVNDEHGHAVGDSALIAVAERLRAVCRGGDLLARWGGEEMVVLSSEERPGGAAALAGRMCDALAVAPVVASGHELALTLSVGWSAWRNGDDAAALLARADRALYAAKASGRGRACSGDAVGST
jgi:two-component system cell cycle response regulator